MFRAAAVCLVALSSSAFAQSFPERHVGSAITAKSARVSLTADGAWLDTPVPPERYLAIFDDTSARPRFAEYVPDARLLFYVDRDALQTVTVGLALIQPSAKPQPKDVFGVVGFVPSAGTAVEVLSEKNGYAKVRVTSGDLEITGFVAKTSIGTTFRYGAFVRPEWRPDAYLPESFTLLDKPSGAVFVTAKPTADRQVMVLKKSAGHALVRTANSVVGWIAAKKLGRIPEEGGVEGGEEGIEGGAAGGVSTRNTLPSGTPLFDSIDGTFVGVASFFTAKPVATKGEWSRYVLKTPYGNATVWSSSAIGPEQSPQNVPPTLLEGSRIAGEKNIIPDDDTKKLIAQSGKDKLVGSWKLCVDRTGTVTLIKKLKSTGFESYDKAIEAGMEQWRYRPYQVNGKAVPVCTAITFIYSQK